MTGLLGAKYYVASLLRGSAAALKYEFRIQRRIGLGGILSQIVGSKVFQDRAPEYILIIAVPILSNALVPQFHVNRLVLGGIRERGNLPIHVFKR